jgi:hypothetical protein
MSINFFNNPEYYRKLILSNRLLDFKKKQFRGKSIICVFLTRFCNVGCPFCFFKSAPAWRKQNIEDQFSDQGLEKFIVFANQANLGYLLVSGGGEPLNKRNHILAIVNKVEADKIVLVTSGNWAVHYDTAEQYIRDLYQAFYKRKFPTTLVIRISISEGHSIKLGLDPIINLIKIFEQYYSKEDRFLLQIKTFENDKMLGRTLQKLQGAILSSTDYNYTSDSDLLIKTIYKKQYLIMPSGYSIKVGVSKVFESGHRPDLNNVDKLQKALYVYDLDLRKAQCYKPGLVFNTNGEEGIDWSIGYQGNVSVWQGQVRDNDMNIYYDSFADVLKAYLEDPITYSFLDKGSLYREKILSEINPRTILRSRSIGLRDLVGAILFEDKRDRLYYAIRVLQDYIREKQILDITYWPKDIIELVNISTKDLISLYKNSSYNIVKQEVQKLSNRENWYDFLELIKLGHYDLNDDVIKEAIDYYNTNYSSTLSNIQDIEPQIGMVEHRLTDRLAYKKTYN